MLDELNENETQANVDKIENNNGVPGGGGGGGSSSSGPGREYINYWTNERVRMVTPPTEPPALDCFVSLNKSNSFKMNK